MLSSAVFGLLFMLSTTAMAAGPKEPVRLAIDAEFGVKMSTSAQAIQRGAEIAAAEVNAAGGVLGGRPLQIVTRNNNSVPARAAENLRELAADPSVVAVMCGKHSPVVQHLLPLIHELGMPLLDPWAAADDITRYPRTPNFVFRLSLTDSWALDAMLRSAVTHRYRRLGLLLPNSGWGRSSQGAAHKAVASERNVHLVGEQWFNFGDTQFTAQYDTLRKAGAEAILLVANELEAAAFVRETAQRPEAERLPIFAHWGLTGGQFFALAGDRLAEIDLLVVQTYSFIGAKGDRAQRVVAALKKQGLAGPADIESPVGVAHAYDLTHLLVRAIDRAGKLDRAAIRDALEHLPEYRGLVRHYRAPFTPTRHEALDPSVVFMARFADGGAIVRAR
jgi:branched-chain amino acid transport system substrate-binding protein